MYVFLYLLAIVLANLSVTKFGSTFVVINAFLLIGLDLTSRDKLHEKWHNKNLFLKMSLLIFMGSFLSWIINNDSGRIAIASFLSFAITASIDTVIYQILIKKSKIIKVNGSNIVSAITDSIIFPTIAFGEFIWGVVLGQIIAKFLGGFLWSILLNIKKE